VANGRCAWRERLQHSPGMASASILIAEDDFNFRDTVEDALVEDGHSVVCARNGAEALVALNKIRRPALLLLDLHMPVMDGVTFLTHLQFHPLRDDFEVIIMSAMVNPQRLAHAPCVVQAMRKPFDISEIQELVWKFAERRPASAMGSRKDLP
jgi:CheY-like chemotaxis protein